MTVVKLCAHINRERNRKGATGEQKVRWCTATGGQRVRHSWGKWGIGGSSDNERYDGQEFGLRPDVGSAVHRRMRLKNLARWCPTPRAENRELIGVGSDTEFQGSPSISRRRSLQASTSSVAPNLSKTSAALKASDVASFSLRCLYQS